jgi:hypothetical protein
MPLLAASALLAAGTGASLLFVGGTAEAADCSAGPVVFGTACDVPGTMNLISGTLNLTGPPAVGWATTITGADQFLSDPTTADQSFTVVDATGTSPGWNVTATSTAFVSGADTLGTLGATTTPTLSTNGSTALTAGAITTAIPGAECAGTSTCTLPTNLTTPVAYPVAITDGQAASTAPVVIYDADAGTGSGTIVVGFDGVVVTNPIGWWLSVPSNTVQGTYLGTVSLTLNSGP